VAAKKQAIWGHPEKDRVGMSRVERHNLSIRMETRRFTRLTNAFSKKWEKHHAALALYFAYYNFCRMHKTLRCTPGMAQKVTKSVWSLKDLLLPATEFFPHLCRVAITRTSTSPAITPTTAASVLIISQQHNFRTLPILGHWRSFSRRHRSHSTTSEPRSGSDRV
jgi:hypothetical protein